MRIGALIATSPPSRQIHYSGFPPQVGAAGSSRTTLPAARFVTIEVTTEGFFYFDIPWMAHCRAIRGIDRSRRPKTKPLTNMGRHWENGWKYRMTPPLALV